MQHSDSTDAVLVVRCQLGDTEAWDELVQRWNPRLWRFVSRMVPNQATAEDLLQIIWLKVVRSMGRLCAPEHLTAWMYRITRSAIADHLRHQYRRPPPNVLGETSQSDARLESLETTEMIETALSDLHPMDREAVVLHYLEQLSVAEVAEVCDVPVGTVKSRLHRARCLLRQSLTKNEN